MQEPYLEVTFRHGRPLAAYYYLPRQSGQKSRDTRRVEPGLVVDYDEHGKPLGIEITAPSQVTLALFNQLLEQLGQAPIAEEELAPLRAA